MSLPWDYIAKLVCIGDSGTGKSSVRIPYTLLHFQYIAFTRTLISAN